MLDILKEYIEEIIYESKKPPKWLKKAKFAMYKNKKVKETLDILNMLDRTLYNQLRSEISGR